MNSFFKTFLGCTSHQNIKGSGFDTVVGHTDIKKIFLSAIESKKHVRILIGHIVLYTIVNGN
jgi:hypothetical protein